MTGMFSYFRRIKKTRTKGEKHIRNPTISFDESGCFRIGVSYGAHFTMVAVVIDRYERYDKIANDLPKTKKGFKKSCDADTEERKHILLKVVENSADIYFSSRRKTEINTATSEDKAKMYAEEVEELLNSIFSNHPSPIFDLLFESNSIIGKARESQFIEMCHAVAEHHGKKPA